MESEHQILVELSIVGNSHTHTPHHTMCISHHTVSTHGLHFTLTLMEWIAETPAHSHANSKSCMSLHTCENTCMLSITHCTYVLKDPYAPFCSAQGTVSTFFPQSCGGMFPQTSKEMRGCAQGIERSFIQD